MSRTLVILGASSRAAAFSALRAGLKPFCADCFADADLAAGCVVRRVESWPDDLLSLEAEFPPGPWMYAGGVENHPSLVEQLSSQRPLLGNRGQSLRAARDPFHVRQLLEQAGIACPRVEQLADGLNVNGAWLRKSRRSAGGFGVSDFHGSAAGSSDDYFQQWIAGLPCSAAYIAAHGRAQLIGFAEQIMCGPHGRDRFRWAGAVGPLPCSAALERLLVRLGGLLAESLGLIGLFGVDGILVPPSPLVGEASSRGVGYACHAQEDMVGGAYPTLFGQSRAGVSDALLADGVFWPVELNPRYTGSMEIYERASGRSMAGEHVAACLTGELPESATPRSSAWHAKLVLFAESAADIDDALVRWIMERNATSEWPMIADIPRAGSAVAAGEPLLTVFAAGSDRRTALEGLEQLRGEVLERC